MSKVQFEIEVDSKLLKAMQILEITPEAMRNEVQTFIDEQIKSYIERAKIMWLRKKSIEDLT